jgi:sigma-B regulation protein RsbU (phosphoserine phosphatase)
MDDRTPNESKILVVDDEPDLELLMRQKFRRKIQDQSYRFVFAQNGADALKIAQEDSAVHVVMTDINMPQMDGLTLLGKLRETINDRIVESIVVSAYGDMQNIRTAMNRGAFDFLTKPIDFQDLELTLNKTLDRVNAILQAMQARQQLHVIRQELDVAARIQQSILPRKFPAFPNRPEFDIYAYMIPAKEVGGDFYDFFLIDADHIGFVIGDVSGKGVPSAIFMANCRALLRSIASRGVAPGDCLTQVNKALAVDSESGMFVTVFYGILDTRTGEVSYANGGHNPPYHVVSGGEVRAIEGTSGLVVVVLDGFTFADRTLQLAPGDRVLLYTDGVTEAMNAQDDMYSDERLHEFLGVNRPAALSDVVHAIIDDVKRFANGHPQSDDITSLVIQYSGAQA